MNLCNWQHIWSHYQQDFVDAWSRVPNCNAQMLLFGDDGGERASQGWEFTKSRNPLVTRVQVGASVDSELDRVLPTWRDAVHLVSPLVPPSLITAIEGAGASWVHWSEAPGFGLLRTARWAPWVTRALHRVSRLPRPAYWKSLAAGQGPVLANGAFASDVFRALGIARRRIIICPYSIDGDSAANPDREVQDWADGEPIVLFAGGADPRKGLQVLLKARARMPAPVPRVVLLGDLRGNSKVSRQVDALVRRGAALALGPVSQARVREVMAASSLVVMPSLYDGWGVVANEAAVNKKPVIVTDTCGAREMVARVDPELVVRAGSSRSLLAAMARLVRGPEAASYLGVELSRVHRDIYSADAVARRVKLELEALLR